MITPTDTSNNPLVSCEVCAKQIPASEAQVPEAVDYFVHFCGAQCYDLWQKKIKQDQAQQASKPAS